MRMNCLTGTIVHGRGKGGPAGFPTANLCLDAGGSLPEYGVYATFAHLPDGVIREGVTNVGTRPTADNSDAATIETLIEDYSGDLYGLQMTLEIAGFIRKIRTFASMEALREQIERDGKTAARLWREYAEKPGLLVLSQKEMETLGERLGRALRGGDVVLLRGDLGAGKTVFTRGVARGMGVSGAVSSPTFTLMHCHKGALALNHMDLYRLETDDEFYDAGLEDAMNERSVCMIEWPEKCEGAMPQKRLTVRIEYGEKEGERRVSIQPEGGFREINL